MNPSADGLRSNIETRSEHDTVIFAPPLIFILLIPIIVGLVLVMLCNSPDFIWKLFPARLQALSGYWWTILRISIPLEGFVLLVAIYIMFDRLRTHSARDDGWRESLMGYVRSQGLSAEDMGFIDAEIRESETFGKTWVLRVLIVLSMVFVVLDACVLVPVMYAWGYLENTLLMASIFLPTFVLAIAGLLSVFLKMYTVSYEHEALQAAFTERMSEALSQKGISVQPMRHLGKTPNAILALVFSLATLGLGAIVLVILSNKAMNDHLYNQWCYETYLLDKIEGRDNGNGYEVGKDRSAKKTQKQNRAPKAVLVTELLVIVLILNYILRLIGITVDNSYMLTINGAEFNHIGNYAHDILVPRPGFSDMVELSIMKTPQPALMTMVSLLLIILAFYAVAGLRSARPQSWRKVARTCITFAATAVLSAFMLTSGYSHMFDFNVYLTVSILYVLFLMLILSRSIKKYYTPYGQEVPPTLEWMRYAIVGKMKKD